MTSPDSRAELYKIFISFRIALYWLILNFDTKDIFMNTVNGPVDFCGDALKENLHFYAVSLIENLYDSSPSCPQVF